MSHYDNLNATLAAAEAATTQAQAAHREVRGQSWQPGGRWQFPADKDREERALYRAVTAARSAEEAARKAATAWYGAACAAAEPHARGDEDIWQEGRTTLYAPRGTRRLLEAAAEGDDLAALAAEQAAQRKADEARQNEFVRRPLTAADEAEMDREVLRGG
jgi:hypothetical protein